MSWGIPARSKKFNIIVYRFSDKKADPTTVCGISHWARYAVELAYVKPRTERVCRSRYGDLYAYRS